MKGIAFFLTAVAVFTQSPGTAVPFQLTVNHRTTECFYEQLNEGESATMSIFVISGSELLGEVEIDGPLAESNINSGAELHEASVRFDRGQHPAHGQVIHRREVVDYEHLNLNPGDDDYMDDDTETENETEEQRRERRARQRKKALEARQRREKERAKQRQVVRDEGKPFIFTIKAPVDGWYRFCVKNNWNQITAEIDLRKQSEYGGLDEYGNVWSQDEKSLKEESDLLAQDSATEEGIKDEDFQSTREKLKTLRRLLADIQAKQNQERHRLLVHSATNEHSHSRMVLNSLMETVLFMVVTGFQVYTIRRWFKGAPALGR